MKITIEHYKNKYTYENEWGANGLPFMNRDVIDETNLPDAIEAIANLLVLAGWSIDTIKSVMNEYSEDN